MRAGASTAYRISWRSRGGDTRWPFYFDCPYCRTHILGSCRVTTNGNVVILDLADSYGVRLFRLDTSAGTRYAIGLAGHDLRSSIGRLDMGRYRCIPSWQLAEWALRI